MNEEASDIEAGADVRGTVKRVVCLVLDINGYIFLTSFLVYLVLQVMEMLREGSVYYFNDPDKVLYLCVATGAIYILANRYGSADTQVKPQGISLRRVLPSLAAAAILAGLLTYRLMSAYGVYAVLIAVAAGILTGVTACAASSPCE